MSESTANWKDITPARLLAAHLSRPGNTARCYRGDMDTLAEFLNVQTEEKAVEMFLSMPRGSAKLAVGDYVTWLRERYPALSTIRRKAQSLMGLLRLAHECDVIPWMLNPLRLPAPSPIRNTRGPDRDAVEDMISACDGRSDPKGARDSAIISLMAFAALRCNETLSLDLKHVDIDAREVEIMAKGLWGTVKHPVPLKTIKAIERWLTFRGFDDGPLFTTPASSRLTYWGCYYAITAIGHDVGIKTSPHKLRHFAATEHLRLSRGNVAWAMALTRHRDPQTLMIYNDERMTRAREAGELVAAGVPCYRLGTATTDN